MPSALALIAGLFLSLFNLSADPQYEIDQYVATFTLTQSSPHVAVELDITYEIFAGEKSDGFKYVGHYEPTNVRGVDAEGRPIHVSVRRYRENQIYWSFPAVVGPGTQRVIIHFTLHNALWGNAALNTLSAPWVGVFKVPVRHASYRVVLPLKLTPSQVQSMWPEPHTTQVDFQGRTVLRADQNALSERELLVRFTPGIVVSAQSTATPSTFTSDGFKGFANLLMLLFFIGYLGLWTYNRYRRQHGLSTMGGCGSTSSSGGGCGGGCGGGGCGGGCGG